MKQFGLFLLALTMCTLVRSQATDSVPAYQRPPALIPVFNLLLTDSTAFNTARLPKGKMVVITYFNPECGHCQDEAKLLSENMSKFKKVIFVMAASKGLDLISEFRTTFGLDKFRNIRMGQDIKYFLPGYYRVQSTPFTAVYDKKGRFVKAFEHGYTIEELQKLVRPR